mmetsp:Transcript_19860/g.28116  ORF Transcript_19860/g.28116 Transcript_19860/m.28116 type:complete len:817 (+) Transcript_19860:54-2504(+)
MLIMGYKASSFFLLPWILLLTSTSSGYSLLVSSSPSFVHTKSSVRSGGSSSSSTSLSLSSNTLSKTASTSILENKENDFNNDNSSNDITGEVVAASGRMGSFWLAAEASTRKSSSSSSSPNVVPVPRGVAPGSLSSSNNRKKKVGIPIYVNTPSTSWDDVYEQTLPSRREDLIWIGNGLLSSKQKLSTVVIPHYGMLKAYDKPYTSEGSPPTYIYGKHATLVQTLLEQNGIQTELVTSWTEMKVKAVQKLFWASCMWLFCHYEPTKDPITVKSVHETYTPLLEKLLQELLPIAHDLTSDIMASSSSSSTTRAVVDEKDRDDTDFSSKSSFLKETLQYLEKYSLSIPNAIVKKECAFDEIQTRNGVFLSWRDKYPQPFHEELIANAAGKDILERGKAASTTATAATVTKKEENENGQQQWFMLDIPSNYESTSPLSSRNSYVRSSKLSIVCRPLNHDPHYRNKKKKRDKKVVVIGAGILGSSIALNLARRGITNVTVFDHHDYSRQKSSSSSSDNHHDNNNDDNNITNGATTPASWAWLEANGKSSISYQWLNQLGMHYWKNCDSLLKDLPIWNGALVGYGAKPPRQFSPNAGYPMEGPLSKERITELEPSANFKNMEHVYFFPSEGHVDPSIAVRTLRKEAQQRGVEFVYNQEYINLTYENDYSHDNAHDCNTDNQHQQDQIIRGVTTKSTITNELNHMSADIVIVAAGTGSSASMFGGGLVEEAIRPIPQDGLPAIGYMKTKQTLSNDFGDGDNDDENNSGGGLYMAVTHSSMTLGPLIGALVACEVAENVSCELLDPFRPGRFFSSKIHGKRTN